MDTAGTGAEGMGTAGMGTAGTGAAGTARTRRSRRTRTGLLVAAMVGVGVLGLAACAAGPNEAAGVGDPDVAGFWLGLWQGAISPITFVVSLFNPDVGIYEIHNNGNWYNFGFMLGVSCVFSGGAGGGAASGRRRRR